MARRESPFRSERGEAAYVRAYEATLRLWPVAFEPMDVTSRFGTTHLVACGPAAAPPMVLLHSFFMSLTVWAYNVGDLGRDHRVYALDMMGQPGRSVPGDRIRNRAEMAEWLTSVLDALAVPRTVLVGWSYGGFAALNYALHRPDRLTGLVLLTPIGSFVPLRTRFYVRGLLTRLPGRFWADRMMRWFCYEPALANDDAMAMFRRLSDQFHAGLKHFRLPPTVLPTPYADGELRRVTTPTLLLIGDQEALYDPGAAMARARQLVPGLASDLIPQTGHELGFTEPDLVDSRILDFLRRREAARAPAASGHDARA